MFGQSYLLPDAGPEGEEPLAGEDVRALLLLRLLLRSLGEAISPGLAHILLGFNVEFGPEGKFSKF